MRRALLISMLLVAVCAPQALAAKDETILISRQSAADGGSAANGGSFHASVSADGRYVAFNSAADNLSTADNDAFDNVFIHDTQTGVTTLVSRQSSGDGGAGADAGSTSPSISADGRYVAFLSTASNLSSLDNDGHQNIFVRDTQANITTLATRQSTVDGGAGADGSSFDPTISGDGRFVAFQSAADNLSTIDDNILLNAFVRDMQSNTTSLVSRQSDVDGGAAADGAGNDPFISANGRYVAFESNADNLSTDDNDTLNNIYVRDLQTNSTTFASRQSSGDGGAAADSGAFDPALSGDGRHVAFETSAQNLSTVDGNATIDVFVRDLQTSTTLLASRQSAGDGGAGADGNSDEPSLSTDGRFVAFDSDADNLSSADNNAFANAFVYDLQAGTTTLVSRQSAAGGGAGADDHTAMSPHGTGVSGDGRFVVFSSGANNLSTADNDAFFNIFLRDVLGGAAPPVGGDTDPPDLLLKAKKTQEASKPIKVKVTADEACRLQLTGTVKPNGEKKGKLKPKQADLAAGMTTTLKLKPSKKLGEMLAEVGKGKAKLAATCTDAAGNSAQAKLKVQLK